jgi:hypothetical protein
MHDIDNSVPLIPRPSSTPANTYADPYDATASFDGATLYDNERSNEESAQGSATGDGRK